MPLTDEELEGLAKGFAPVIKQYVAQELAPLIAGIAELKARPELKYAGVHVGGQIYTEGALVTRGGALWLAEITTSASPGTGPNTGWKLIVKRGTAGSAGLGSELDR